MLAAGGGGDVVEVTKGKHTPGPWHWDGDASNMSPEFRENEAPWIWGDAGMTPVLKGDVEVPVAADSRLIAAAPTMLEALKGIYAGVVSGATSEWRININVSQEAFKALESAIALAEGAE
jgi:hypothetical protein